MLDNISDHSLMPTPNFRNGIEFPNEGFLQGALEKHFAGLGFTDHGATTADIDLRHPVTGEHWIVEAKGDTRGNSGLDFKTGLGQLLMKMQDPKASYGIAVPDTPRFLALCAQVSEQTRERLNLHWLLLDPDGRIRTVPPARKTNDRSQSKPAT